MDNELPQQLPQTPPPSPTEVASPVQAQNTTPLPTEKDLGGRPLIYKTVEELQACIDEYFTYCDNRTKKLWDDKLQKEFMISDPAPYTMHGLARALHISRQALMEYSHREQFGDAIKEAREKVAEDVETRMMDGKAQSGAIFNLKNNFGWKDETKSDVKSQVDVNIRDYTTQYNPATEAEDSTK